MYSYFFLQIVSGGHGGSVTSATHWLHDLRMHSNERHISSSSPCHVSPMDRKTLLCIQKLQHVVVVEPGVVVLVPVVVLVVVVTVLVVGVGVDVLYVAGVLVLVVLVVVVLVPEVVEVMLVEVGVVVVPVDVVGTGVVVEVLVVVAVVVVPLVVVPVGVVLVPVVVVVVGGRVQQWYTGHLPSFTNTLSTYGVGHSSGHMHL